MSVSKKTLQKYITFHGHKPREIDSFNVPVENLEDGLIVLGNAHAIEYVTDKINGGGDGTRAIYRHKFSPGAKLCCDKTGKKVLYILSSKIKTTSAGIEN